MRSRVVAVTGGTRGIGRAIAEAFHRQGARVAVCGRSADRVSSHRGIQCQAVDVRDRRQVRKFLRGVKSRSGWLDVLVNCAGVSRWRAVQRIDEEFASEIIETNLLGTLWASAAAAGLMKRGGVIVNVSSLAGKRGSANNSAYCAAKFAVNGITQALARELGPRGIRVNAVCPVYVATASILASLAEPDSPVGGRRVKRYLAQFAAKETALKRLPTASEVASLVCYLASAQASAITGQCINVDCGTFPQ